MPFEIRPHPDFSWSHSRDATFSDCARKYYWQYCGSHNGWLSPEEVPEHARLAYRLKQLASLHTVFGTAVHDVAKDWALLIRSGEPPFPYHRMAVRVTRVLRHAHRCSTDRDAFLRDPKRHPMLQAMYYEGRFVGREVAAVRGKMERCLFHLSKCRLWRELPWFGPDGIVVVDTLDSAEIDGVTLYAAPDLVLRADDHVEIVDWKTGRDEEIVRAQLGLYAFFAERKLGLPFSEDRWRGRVIRLHEGSDDSFGLRRRDLRQAEERMRASVAFMRTFLADPGANAPKPLDAFPKAHRELRWRCPFCNFRQFCLGAPRPRVEEA